MSTEMPPAAPPPGGGTPEAFPGARAYRPPPGPATAPPTGSEHTVSPPRPPVGPGTTLLRVGGAVLAVLLVVACAVAVVGRFARQERTETTVYDQELRSLFADTETGSVRVRTGAPGSDVTVRRTLEWSFGEPRAADAVTGDRLDLRGDCTRSWALGGCSISYEVTVPPGLQLTINSSTGSIEVQDADGDLRATTSTGSITMTGLRSDAVSAETSTGSVDLGFAAPPTTVRGSTSTGSVDVRVPDDGTKYAVRATTSVGDRRVTVPEDSGSSRTIEARTSTGSVDVRTAR